MSAAIRKPWTQAEFFAWVGHADGRYEFDGFQPVAMTGGAIIHNVITQNLYSALRVRLRRGRCRSMGPDAGLATMGDAVRYPDALVTCSDLDMTALTVPGVVVVFEVLSPTSGRTDRIVKLREYAAVASIRRYVILESAGSGVTAFGRGSSDEPWQASALTIDDVLPLPEIGIEIPVAEFYEGVDLVELAEDRDGPPVAIGN